MNLPETNDPLDALLREQNLYVEDNGFTMRVISALPRRRPQSPVASCSFAGCDSHRLGAGSFVAAMGKSASTEFVRLAFA